MSNISRMDYANFARILRALREREGLSTRNITSSAGIKPSSISYYEHQRQLPRPRSLEKLANLFNIKVTDFFRESPPDCLLFHQRKLKELREEHGYAVVDVCAKTSIREPILDLAENGVVMLNLPEIIDLCKLYNTTPNKILGFD